MCPVRFVTYVSGRSQFKSPHDRAEAENHFRQNAIERRFTWPAPLPKERAGVRLVEGHGIQLSRYRMLIITTLAVAVFPTYIAFGPSS